SFWAPRFSTLFSTDSQDTFTGKIFAKSSAAIPCKLAEFFLAAWSQPSSQPGGSCADTTCPPSPLATRLLPGLLWAMPSDASAVFPLGGAMEDYRPTAWV